MSAIMPDLQTVRFVNGPLVGDYVLDVNNRSVDVYDGSGFAHRYDLRPCPDVGDGVTWEALVNGRVPLRRVPMTEEEAGRD